MREVPLTQGYAALVDDEDYEYLMQWKWQYVAGYAKAVDKVNKTGKHIAMHRLLLDASDGEIVDHANRNKLDNQKSNLRISDCLGNSRNRNKYNMETSSKFKGVCLDKKRGKYVSAITVDGGNTFYLGHYKSEENAAYYYNKYASKHFGEFAVLNDLGNDFKPSEPFGPDAHMQRKSSKYRGVSRRKSDGKFRAYIVKDWKQISLGVFESERIAAEMYNTAAIELHGENAKLNIFDQMEGIVND